MQNTLAPTALSWVDGAIIVVFVGATAWLGSYFRKWIKKPDDFYVAGRQLTPFILAATLAATNCSLYNFQSYVGYAYREGISIVWHEWTGLMAMVFAGIFVLPMMRRLRIATIPEFLGRRYSPSLRVLVAVLWSLRFGVALGGILYLGAQIACVVGGFSDTGPAYHAFIFLFAVITVAYTMAGGMWAVALTDVLQFVFLLGGALIMIPLIMHTVGYWQGMQQTLSEMGHGDLLTLVPKEGMWNWKGAVGIWLLGMQWACTDQTVVQRAFSSKSVKGAAKAMVYGGLMMIPLAFIIPMPGIAAAIGVSQGTMPALLEQDNALPMLLVSGVLPVGLLGFILCGLIASQLSSIDSILSSASTLVVLDIVNPCRKKELTDRQTLLALRLMILVIGAVMILTSYLAKAAQSAIDVWIGVISIVDLPLFVVAIIYGFLWKRATPAGAIAGYLIGMGLGLVIQFHAWLGSGTGVLVDGIYWLYSYLPMLGEDVTTATASGWDTAVIGMVVTAVTVPLVSWFTKQPRPEQVDEVWKARQVSQEEHRQGELFHVWPVSRQGRFFVCMMLASLVMFLTGLVLGRYPAQEGYSIRRSEMRRFEQAALLIPAEDLPPGITVESRRKLLDDLTVLAKNTDRPDGRRKPLADNLSLRMKELMTSYCHMVESHPRKYGKGYLDEFRGRIESAQAGPGRAIRDNSIAGPVAVVGMLLYCFCGLMRLRYD